MKICITAKEASPESKVEKSFGRTPFLAVYDTESKEFNFIENTNRNLSGGVGPRTAQMVIDNNAKALLTGMIGDNAKRTIDAAGIPIITVNTEKTLKEAVSDFEAENPVN